MTKKKDESHWFILLAVIIIILIVIALTSVNSDKISEREAEVKRRNEEEKRLIKELKELESKQEIYTKHESIHAFTEKYMSDLCEKRYVQLIQVLIILLVVANTFVFFAVPDMKILDLFTWNAIALGLLNVVAIFFFASVKRGKSYLKGIAMNYIEYRVYENRDKTYFTQKVKFYQQEIEKIKTEIEAKSNQLKQI